MPGRGAGAAGRAAEHHWLRLCYAWLGHLFPCLPHQPGYHKRLKAAAPLLAATIDHLARQSPSWQDQVRLIDATPVPCGASRETVKRSDAELVCLAVAQVLRGARSEHHWLRMCCARRGHLFAYLPHQPGYHQRVKAAAPLLAAVLDYLARECPSW